MKALRVVLAMVTSFLLGYLAASYLKLESPLSLALWLMAFSTFYAFVAAPRIRILRKLHGHSE